MLPGFHNKQKSLTRRFLPILRAVVFFAAGVTVILWDKVLPEYGYKKTLFGCLLMLYAVVRFVLLLRKERKDDE
jgi:hypothetical protein